VSNERRVDEKRADEVNCEGKENSPIPILSSRTFWSYLPVIIDFVCTNTRYPCLFSLDIINYGYRYKQSTHIGFILNKISKNHGQI